MRCSVIQKMLWTLILSCCVLVPLSLAQPLSESVLVVFNKSFPDSRKVADYYVAKRHLPRANRCAINVFSSSPTGAESVPWAQLDAVIRNPIKKCLKAVGKDKILYIVFAYGTPYRLDAVPAGSGVSIDQYVADIWDESGGLRPTPNPYFAKIASGLAIYPGFISLAEYRRSAGAKRIYSVWRLDAATAALARGLVDKALTGESNGLAGQVCIDRRFGKNIRAMPDSRYVAADWDLFRAAEFFRDKGLPVTEDSTPAEFGTPPAPARCEHAIFYAGWYSLNHYNDVFSWEPGAIGVHLDSESAINPRSGNNWSANALKHGITVTSGALKEPYLPGLPHVDGIVHDLLAGANAGDAFLRNTETLKWMIINIGDPLYRPRFLIPGKADKK